MKFIKKHKAVLIFYLVIVACTLIYSNDIKHEKSISAGFGITDIQK